MLHTYFISLDATITITENKSAELITENESVEAITENERAEKLFTHRMHPVKGREWKQINQGIIHTLRDSLGKTREIFCLRGMKSGTGYTTTKLKIVYPALFALMPTTTTWLTTSK